MRFRSWAVPGMLLGLAGLPLGLAGCTAVPSALPAPPPTSEAAGAVVVSAAPPVSWLPYERASFERAKRENKLIILSGKASWCHFCHVMDDTTYADLQVRRVIAERFIAIRVDIDARPDIGERYGAWGWPATIVLDPDGAELGKFRGFIEPNDFLPLLDAALVEQGRPQEQSRITAAARRSARVEELGFASAVALAALDSFYDDALGGWGVRQKAPLGEALEMESRRARRGDQRSARRVAQTVAAQRKLIDPVWGGVYQYSVGGDWDHAHYEKLMTYQAANLAAYAEAYAFSHDPAVLADARKIASYMMNILSSPEGRFFVSQDADLRDGAGEPMADGKTFYALGDAERRALGMPRIDTHFYGYEAGIAISALCDYASKTGDSAALLHARRGADLALEELVSEGKVTRPSSRHVRFLVDAAALARGLSQLGRATGEPSYRDQALLVTQTMLRDFAAPEARLFANTPDPDAVGSLATPRTPLSVNVLAARALAELAESTGDETLRQRGRIILAAVSTPADLDDEGRMIGGYVLAADELGLCDTCGALASRPAAQSSLGDSAHLEHAPPGQAR